MDVKAIPSPEQIRDACALIQEKWTERERLRRSGAPLDDNGHIIALTIPTIRLHGSRGRAG